jgi:hypothetical protein
MGSAAFLVEACRQLGDALTKAWHAHNEVPSIPADEDEALHAQRLIAQRCLYGLDKNPMAADLAKLSLWLATLAKDHPFTFLDHSLRHGDALVGLTRKQIASFNLAPVAQQTFLEEKIRHLVDIVSQQRREILDARENTPYAQLEQELAVADERLSLPRIIGDAAIAAFFAADKPKQREEARMRLLACMAEDLKKDGFIAVDGEVDRAIQALRKGPKGVNPFHWELEFPEVFINDAHGNATGGFDLIVGNPPFMGGSKLSTAAGKRYTSWLATLHEGAHGKSDLVAHFFRRAFTIVRDQGTFGLIATKTIRQGDTRETGLLSIRRNGGIIYRAETRKLWPGEAAVVVSVVHVAKSKTYPGTPKLNNRPVETITAYLFHMGPDTSPATLLSNAPLVHSGTNINGKGFVLTTELRTKFISEEPDCASRIRPYLGAEEMNESPTASASRFVIYMEGLSEDQAREFPVLYRHLYDTVRLQRQTAGEQRLRDRWWLYSRPANELYSASKGMSQIIASGRAGSHLCFVFQTPETVFSDALTCFIFDNYRGFAVLQSRVHELWAHFFGSSLKDDPRYIPEDCFETFPLPHGYESSSELQETGETYYEQRSRVMVQNNEGLTAIYNRFHDPEECSAETTRLRELHDAIDRAVLRAYGWTDLRPICEFIHEFEDEDEEDENGRERKKKYRYRWPDEIRDEVLVRLLELNRKRALEEGQLLVDSVELVTKRENGKKKKRGADAAVTPVATLFASEKEDD